MGWIASADLNVRTQKSGVLDLFPSPTHHTSLLTCSWRFRYLTANFNIFFFLNHSYPEKLKCREGGRGYDFHPEPVVVRIFIYSTYCLGKIDPLGALALVLTLPFLLNDEI